MKGIRGPQNRRDIDLAKMVWGMEPLCWEGGLGELGVFHLEKSRIWGDLSVVFQKGAGERLLKEHGVRGQEGMASN